MKISEFDLESLIWDDLMFNKGELIRRNGLSLPHFEVLQDGYKIAWYRQLNIEPYGILDLAG